MKGNVARPDTAAILGGLKDFQRDTVEYVFGRLYGPEPTSRFLVADEVGLGKTLVARGVIARAIDHLWEKKDRIDIIYICANADIARQNVNRLNVTRQQEFNRTERITLLPTRIQDLQRNPLNFISLTPGTSFDLKSSLGNYQERVLLYRLLEEPWGFRGVAPRKVFQGNCTLESFDSALGRAVGNGGSRIDPGLAEQFRVALEHHMAHQRGEGIPTLRDRFDELCERFRYARSAPSPEAAADRARWVGEVRTLLATSCLRALKPDLIILDEFQRFRDLLTDKNELGQLASDLFEYDDVRVLLLSATPYKMYTLTEESGDENHYADFVRTLGFLQFDPDETAAFECLIDDFRRELFRLEGGDLDRLLRLKEELEGRLRHVVVRTERLAVTKNRDGMLLEAPREDLHLTARDVGSYPKLFKITSSLDAGDVLEFWKSAPFLLNFMENYEVKRRFRRALEVPTREDELAALLAESTELLLSWRQVASYGGLDSAHAGLRKLTADTVGIGAWRLLWVPPSLPYYRLGGAFADPGVQRFTKRLVFSAWHVVPKSLACLLSYEAERAMMCSYERAPKNTAEERKRRRPLLRFSRSDGRLTGLPVLAMVYPSLTLAELGDPLSLAVASRDGAGEASLAEVRRAVADRLRPLLHDLTEAKVTGPVDEAWYWAAPILLDLQRYRGVTRRWFSDDGLAGSWAGEQSAEGGGAGDTSLWDAHVARAQELIRHRDDLGPQPDDLAEVLADLALGGPAVTALRALARVSGESADPTRPELRHQAGQVGHAFLHLFNVPEVTAMVRGLNGEEPYWRRVLEYGVDGCLQSVLDEYAHVLRDLQGMTGRLPASITAEVSAAVIEALSLRTSALRLEEIRPYPKRGKVNLRDRTMRGRFAVRFGEERADDSVQGANRAGQVRAAFNSPFWPFVLATTSVGQEGLDFHPYCHAVVHWNLPANPVDLEQREGRVHRYKGHAVRKNLATRFGLSVVGEEAVDPWDALFDAGIRERDPSCSDLVPFWVYPLEDGAAIERHLISMPLSRDAARMDALRRTLAVYRMVFGQSRQEDLVSYLLTHLPESAIDPVVNKLRIDLSPSRGAGNGHPADSACPGS